jgi:pyruvate/2-oxoglutarate dehydrogenase complex dihydrolipoamide dehydrogenase (E3) component
MSVEEEKLRGAQKTALNKKRYADYVAELRAMNLGLPCNQFGEVSVEGVAHKIGCTPKVLLNGALKAQFEKDKELLGIEVKANADSRLVEKAEHKSRENSALSKQLSLKIKECESLRAEVERLTEEIRRLHRNRKEDELSIHELLKTGRRFVL